MISQNSLSFYNVTIILNINENENKHLYTSNSAIKISACN